MDEQPDAHKNKPLQELKQALDWLNTHNFSQTEWEF